MPNKIVTFAEYDGWCASAIKGEIEIFAVNVLNGNKGYEICYKDTPLGVKASLKPQSPVQPIKTPVIQPQERGEAIACPRCHEVIDPDTCCCGDPMKGHGWGSGRCPVPMGCVCFYDKDPRKPAPPAEPDTCPDCSAPVQKGQECQICAPFKRVLASKGKTFNRLDCVGNEGCKVSADPVVRHPLADP